MDMVLTLAQSGKTRYSIVIADSVPMVVFHAAEELSRFLEEITGARFSVLTEAEAPQEPVIALGKTAWAAGEDFAALGEEGYTLKTAGENVIIAANHTRGALYGAFGLLEKYCGCRFFTEDVRRIPKRSVLTLPQLGETFVPQLEYRDPYFRGYTDPDLHARWGSNSKSAPLGERYGWNMRYKGFVHTFFQLVPPEKYYDEHPEYFSEIDGVRVRPNGTKTPSQLCLTNPEVAKIATATVRQWIAENPHTRIISVSQNDWLGNCQCAACRKSDEEEGSPAGTLVRFLNTIAEDIEKDYPDVLIDTLAYRYTRTAPKKTRTRRNVCIRLCSIECCFAHPLEECGKNDPQLTDGLAIGRFLDDLRDWGKVCDRLYIWDYVVNFKHTLMPFANLRVLQPNIRFFIRNHVRGIFEEGNNSSRESGELNALRQYLLSRLLWDPDCDVDREMDEFLTAYYGMAAHEIRAYIDLIHDQFDADTHMWIYDDPDAAYLPDSFLDASEALFDRAEQVADDDVILERVQRLRLSLRYVRLWRQPVGTPGRDAQLDAFFADVRAHGITSYRESQGLDKVERQLREGVTRKWS